MLSRRELIKRAGIGTVGFVAVSAFGPPACEKISKDKAVQYTDLAINYLKDASPLIAQLGGTQVIALIDKAIPALEKLKAKLQEDGIPDVSNLWDTVTNIMGQIANALLQLPESAKRNTVMAILLLAQVTLRTVGLFVESETPPSAMAQVPDGVRKAAKPNAMRQAFDATRF